VPWPIAVSFLVRPLADEFTLGEVYERAQPLRRAFPNNKHVEAKIRQSLQILRDRGQIAFDGHGHYRKLAATVQRSVRLDFSEAATYVSRSQVARIAVEAWAARNVVCWRCASPLLLVPANTKLLDAVCSEHAHEVQIKATARLDASRITGAAYGPLSVRLQESSLPDYLLVLYDEPRAMVILAEYLDGQDIVADRIVARKALAATARRAGWVGASINVSGLERHVVVGPSFQPEVETWQEVPAE
jgi:hypothetical protein